MIYLVIRYVPIADADPPYEWKDKEFSKLKELNFCNGLVLLEYMRRFTIEDLCKYELERLKNREYSTCVRIVQEGGISFT